MKHLVTLTPAQMDTIAIRMCVHLACIIDEDFDGYDITGNSAEHLALCLSDAIGDYLASTYFDDLAPLT